MAKFEKGNQEGKKFKSGAEQAEIARRGGLASQKAQKETRTFKELVDIVLSRTQSNSKGETESNKMIMIINLANKAIHGDLKAIELITKLQGELKQSIDVTTNGKEITREPLVVEIIDSRDKVDENTNNENL